MVRGSKHHFAPFRVPWFEDMLATGLRSLAVTDRPPRLLPLSSSPQEVCALALPRSVAAPRPGTREEEGLLFWETAAGILGSQGSGRARCLSLFCGVRRGAGVVLPLWASYSVLSAVPRALTCPASFFRGMVT